MSDWPETCESLILRVKDPADAAAWSAFLAIYRPVVYRLARSRGLQDADAIRETSASIPEWLERIVMELLAKSPGDRYASAVEVHTLLEKCLAHVQQPTTVELPVELQLKAKSRKWSAALVIVPACIVIASGDWLFNKRPTEIGDNSASAQRETVSITDASQLQWESDTAELESLRQDFAPIELKTKKLWEIEPTKE